MLTEELKTNLKRLKLKFLKKKKKIGEKIILYNYICN